MHFLLGDLTSLSGQMKQIIPPGISGSTVLNQLSLSGRCSKEASERILYRCLDHISGILFSILPSRGNISGASGCTIFCFWWPFKADKCELELILVSKSQPSSSSTSWPRTCTEQPVHLMFQSHGNQLKTNDTKP